MNKVTIFCYGRNIIVDEDQVKKHLRKDALVKQAMAMRGSPEVVKVMSSIIRLNRTIRQNVQLSKDTL